MRNESKIFVFGTPPPGKVLSAARPCMNATKKDRGGRVTNENVCVSGFQRFGFEPEPARAAPGSEPAERARPASALAWFMACDLNPRPNMRVVGVRRCGKSLWILS